MLFYSTSLKNFQSTKCLSQMLSSLKMKKSNFHLSIEKKATFYNNFQYFYKRVVTCAKSACANWKLLPKPCQYITDHLATLACSDKLRWWPRKWHSLTKIWSFSLINGQEVQRLIWKSIITPPPNPFVKRNSSNFYWVKIISVCHNNVIY